MKLRLHRCVSYTSILLIAMALSGCAPADTGASSAGPPDAPAASGGGASSNLGLGPDSTNNQPFSIPASGSANGKPIAYTIKSKDSLASIARTFRITSRDIIWSNPGLRLPLTVGRILELPPVPGVVVVVKAGDSLASLGATYGVDEATILGFNDIVGDELEAGTVLVIPVDPHVGPNLRFGVQADPIAPSQLMCPIPGAKIVLKFGPTSFALEPPYAGYAHFHLGVDLLAAYGTPILAAAGGKVTATGYAPSFGLRVEITDSYGLVEIYAHMAKAAVDVGQLVQQGEVIGFVGNTGLSVGPHLHFQLVVGGQPNNPLPLSGC